MILASFYFIRQTDAPVISNCFLIPNPPSVFSFGLLMLGFCKPHFFIFNWIVQDYVNRECWVVRLEKDNENYISYAFCMASSQDLSCSGQQPGNAALFQEQQFVSIKVAESRFQCAQVSLCSTSQINAPASWCLTSEV